MQSWAATMGTQRDEIAAVLEESPSLRPDLKGMLPRAFQLGREWAQEETGLMHLPETCPWEISQILDRGFLP